MKSFVSCENPIRITNPYTKEKLVVSCGKCDVCRSRRAISWSDRLEIERRCHPYAVFFTLTYSDDMVPRFEVDLKSRRLIDEATGLIVPFSKVCKDDEDYFYLYSRKYVTYLSSSFIQCFIKRLRSKIAYEEKDPQKKRVRYFINTEYGPTTHRVHHHGILFFESDWFAGHFEKAISEAWSTDNRIKTRVSFGKTDSSLVEEGRKCSSYVSTYVNCVSRLPKIYLTEFFRPRCFFSKHPPLGSLIPISQEVSELFLSGTTRMPMYSSITGRLDYRPLPQVLESRLYPRIRGFSTLPVDALYRLYGMLNSRTSSESPFGCSFITCFRDFRRFVEDSLAHKYGVTFYPDDELYLSNLFQKESSLSRFYSVLVRFENFRYQMNLSVREYVNRIVAYYKQKDYDNLKDQMEFERSYASLYGARNLINIDGEFSQDSPNVNCLTIKSFNFDEYSFAHIKDHFLKNTPDYKEKVSKVRDFVDNNHKTRCKNEYLESRNKISLNKIYVNL